MNVTKPSFFIDKEKEKAHVEYVIKHHIEPQFRESIMVNGSVNIEFPYCMGPDVPDCNLSFEEEQMIREIYEKAGWDSVIFDTDNISFIKVI